MIGLLGVFTAAALTCTSMQEGCVTGLETRALAVVTVPESIAPIPRAKPLRKNVSKLKPAIGSKKANAARNETKSDSPKRKVKVVLQDTPRKVQRKPVLLIGNYY